MDVETIVKPEQPPAPVPAEIADGLQSLLNDETAAHAATKEALDKAQKRVRDLEIKNAEQEDLIRQLKAVTPPPAKVPASKTPGEQHRQKGWGFFAQ